MTERTTTSAKSPAGRKSLFASVIDFLETNGWPHARYGAEPVLRMAYHGDNGDWMCAVRIREDVGQLIIYSVLDLEVPPEKRQRLAEFLVRANYTLLIGNFEMDFEEGEVFFRTYGIADAEMGLGADAIGQLILGNVLMMDKYLPGILSVIDRDMAPEAALNAIETGAPIHADGVADVGVADVGMGHAANGHNASEEV